LIINLFLQFFKFLNDTFSFIISQIRNIYIQHLIFSLIVHKEMFQEQQSTISHANKLLQLTSEITVVIKAAKMSLHQNGLR